MPITYLGQLEIIAQSEIKIDRFGMGSGSVTYKRQVNSSWPKISKGEPFKGVPWLELDNYSISKIGNPYMSITANYFGCEATTEPVWEVNGSATTEPIGSHPDFSNKSAPLGSFLQLNKTIFFDENDNFRGMSFNPDTAKYTSMEQFARRLVGVSNYYMPNCSIRKTYCTKDKPSILANVGKIVQTPPGCPYTISPPRNCLYLGPQIAVRGKTYQVSETWQVSGPYGANEMIYKK